MSKKRRRKEKAPPQQRPRTGLVVVVLVLSAVAALAYHYWPQPVPLPDLDLEAMEPQVAAKVTEHVALVQDAPGSAEAWGRLGMVLHAHGLEREAAQCYEQAIALDGAFDWHYLNVHALRSFDAEKALAESERALQFDSSYPAAHIVRGELLEERGEPQRALEHYQRAVALDATNPMAAFAAGRLVFAQGELERAEELLTRAATLDPEAGAIHASLAQVYRRMGDRERAMKEAALASERNNAVSVTDPIHFKMRQESVSSIAQLERAQLAAKAGDFSRAETIYLDLVALRPDDADMHARLGDVLAQQGRVDEAMTSYRLSLEINPAHPAAHHGLGNMLNAEGEYEEAERHYRLSLESRPDHVPTLVNLGSLAAFRGDSAEAESLFRQGIEMDVTAFGPRRQLGQLYLRQKKWSDAIRELSAALEIDPDSGPVHLEIAVAHASVANFDVALEHAQKALALGEKVPDGMLDELERRARTR